MSEENDNKSQKMAADDGIVDAEVLSETPAAAAEMKTVTEAPSKKSGKAGWIAAGFLAVFIGGVYASPYFEAGLISLGLRSAPTRPDQIAATVSVDLAPLQAQIADLQAAAARHQEILAQQSQTITEKNQTLQQLRQDIDLLAGAQKPGAGLTQGASGADVAGLKAEIARLSDDLARLSVLSAEADPAVSQLSGALALARAESAQLKERLAAIETTMQAVEAGALEASPRGRLVLMLSRMKDRAMAGLPFEAAVAGLRNDISALPALDQQLMGAEIAVLMKASGGIRPYAGLVRDFDPSVAAALRAGAKEDGKFLSSLFTSRRTDAGATGDDALIAKAERLLLARDVAGAVDVLSGLKGAVGQSLAPWRAAAESYVAVNRAFDRLIKSAARSGPAVSTGGLQ